MKRTRTATTLASCVAALSGAPHATAQDFTQGDLYLLSTALPTMGGGFTAGILRINPSTWSTDFIAFTPGSLRGRAAYDPFRDRIITGAFIPAGSVWLVDAAGVATELPYTGNQTADLFAPTGDGRIYFWRSGPDTFAYIDAAGATHELLNIAGTGAAQRISATTMHYDAPTNSLLVADNSTNAGLVTFARLSLTPDGSQVTNVTETTFDASTSSDFALGMNHGPGETIFVKIDDNTNNTNPRMVLVDPATLGVTVFASSGYFGVGGEVAGAYSSRIGLAVVLDSLSNNLRTFALGSVGEGTIVVSGPVSAGGSGELATLVEIVRCPADLNGDGQVSGPDLAALLAAWGQPGPTDLNGDGTTDGPDLAALLAAWGAC